MAIKSIFKLDKEHVSIFLREINVMSELKHPNVLELIGVSINKDMSYILTEYLSKGSLFSVIHDKNIPITKKIQLNLLHQTCLGMDYLHNLKPPILQ